MTIDLRNQIIKSEYWDKCKGDGIKSQSVAVAIVDWFVNSGIIIYSIAQNGYSVTKWEGFPLLGMFLRKKIKDNTGIDIKEDGKL